MEKFSGAFSLPATDKLLKHGGNLPFYLLHRIQFDQRLQRLSGAEIDETFQQFSPGDDGGIDPPALPCSVTPDFIYFGAAGKDLHFFLKQICSEIF